MNREPNSAEADESIRRAIRDFQAGVRREASFRILFETYHRRVQRFFARRLNSTDECLDLTQETFLRVYKGLKGYRGEGPFGAWVYRIAGNLLRRHFSGTGSLEIVRRQVPLEDQASKLPPEEAGSLDRVLHGERRRLLRRAIDRLPPQRRKCLVLWAYYELTYEQIANVLRVSLGTVKAHLAQAREQLQRRRLDKTEEVP